MKTLLLMVSVVLLLLTPGLTANAQTSQTGQAPAAVTATCKDGTTYSGTTHKGACRGHGGVQSFSSDTTAATTPAAPAPTNKPAAPAPPAVTGGGAGQVWVNTASKVYHCPGDRYYGNTKAGTYMTEAAARSAGNRPDHGKACS